MKYLFILFLFASCSKIAEVQPEAKMHTRAARYSQIGRATIQVMKDSTNVGLVRVGFAEIYLSDVTSSINDSIYSETGADDFSFIKGSKKFTIIHAKYPFIDYPAYIDYNLSFWHATQRNYFFRVSGSNFPKKVYAVLYNKQTGQSWELPVHGERLQYIRFSVKSGFTNDYCIRVVKANFGVFINMNL